MTWVKICGITNRDDAHAAVDAGANAIGFVFYDKSPRHVTPAEVKKIIGELPENVEKVGVFVNASLPQVVDAVRECALTAVQLNGDEDKDFSRKLVQALSNGGPRPMIFRAFAAQIFDRPAEQSIGWDPVDVGLVEQDEAYRGKRVQKIHVAQNGDLFLETHGFRPGVISGVLLDSSSSRQRGGTGRTFDWERVQPWAGIINSISKLVVAGGLHQNNVQEAMHILHPWGVDVSTGVEREPRKKDHTKVNAFVHAVRAFSETD